MSYGGNEDVQDAEDECAVDWINVIAHKAAEFVAAGDMGREDAIETATAWARQSREADNDETGIAEAECQEPIPSKSSPPKQVAAIKSELWEAAEAAAATIYQSD